MITITKAHCSHPFYIYFNILQDSHTVVQGNEIIQRFVEGIFSIYNTGRSASSCSTARELGGPKCQIYTNSSINGSLYLPRGQVRSFTGHMTFYNPRHLSSDLDDNSVLTDML